MVKDGTTKMIHDFCLLFHAVGRQLATESPVAGFPFARINSYLPR